MNTTNDSNQDGENPIIFYVMLAEGVLNLLVAVYTSYRLGHIEIFVDNIKCFGSECSGVEINVESDSESKTIDNDNRREKRLSRHITN